MPVLHLDSLIHHIERDTYMAPAGEPQYNARREPSINRVDTTTLALTITAPPTRIVNRGVDTGNISAWTGAGSTGIRTTSDSRTYSARIGQLGPCHADSSINQSFVAPTGTSQLVFWYRVVSTDTAHDSPTATLRDNTTGMTATVLAKNVLGQRHRNQVRPRSPRTSRTR